jgi:hypothetical protein
VPILAVVADGCMEGGLDMEGTLGLVLVAVSGPPPATRGLNTLLNDC